MLGLGETVLHRELADKLYAELKKKLEAGEKRIRPSVVRMESGTRVFAVA